MAPYVDIVSRQMRDPVSEVRAFLVRYCGLPFCADCIAHQLSLGRADVETAITALDTTECVVEQRWCVRCFRSARTARAVA